MLVELRFENHRSVRDEQALTFEAASIGDDRDDRPRRVPGHDRALLPVAAVYGANASGKSNVLAALGFMRQAVALSHRFWSPDGGVPREPFAWGARRADTSLFEVELILDGARYAYGFVCDDTRFREEWLYAWPNGRKQVWFERDDDTFKFGEHLRGENHIVERVTRPNALFLSAAVQMRHAQLDPIFRWFSTIRTVGVARARRLPERPESWEQSLLNPGPVQTSLFGDDLPPPRLPEAFLNLLRSADLGIVDVKQLDDERDPSDPRRPGRFRVVVQHHTSGDDAWLPLEEESQGTRTLFRIGPVILSALDTGGIVVVDELEASLHPLLGLQLVKLFNDPATNPRNAQLVFSTHDTNLLGSTLGDAALRRDQVWLCEKDPEGGTRIYPLTDYKPRKAENLERGYLQGRYGAIPFLGALVRVEA